MRTPTKDQFAAKLARTIHEDLASRLWNAKERLKVFAGLRLKPTITVNPNDGAVSFSFDARAADEDIDATLEELLTMLGRIAADRDRRVVLVLDEFQEVVDIDPNLIKLMRSVFQEQPDVAHIYLGSKRHMMRRIFSDENEPFWRSAKQTELDVIAPELFAQYALRGSRRPAEELDPETCEKRAGAHRRPSLRHPGAALFPLGGGRRSIARWRPRSAPSTLTSACSGTTSQEPRSEFSRLLPRRARGARSAATTSAGIRCRPPRRCRRRWARSSGRSWCGGSAGANTASPSRSSRSGSSGTRARRACRGSRRRSPTPASGCAPRARPWPRAPRPSPRRCPSSRTRSRRRGPSSCPGAP